MALRIAAVFHEEFADEELVARYQAGDICALNTLLERYRRFARAKARTYFLVGADADDIEQEGMIGLYKAARDFRFDRQASFRAFAELCVTRQVITAVKAATRQKHRPLNQYVSISGVRGSDEASERSVEDLLDDHRVADPADEVLSRERMARMRQSYQEIGDQLGRHVKSIDNALQRIKRKLDVHLQEEAVDEAADGAAGAALLVVA
jgi:RNA polymerase sporulation-specific sigma factor